jgi:adenylate kinase
MSTLAETIIFIGPQGSGKGTQVEALSAAFAASQLPVFVAQTGQPFRELAARGGYAAARVRDTIEAGHLVPHVIVNALVVKELVDNLSPDTNLIFDGYPRDVAQAETLEAALNFFERSALTVIHLDTPDEVVIARMKGRGRSDDTDAVIAERLRLYHSLTEPLVAYYQARPHTNFITVNGALPISEVTAIITTKLGLTE